MSIEARPGLVDYWHDLYLVEVATRYRILETLALPVSAEERLAEVQRIAEWRESSGAA